MSVGKFYGSSYPSLRLGVINKGPFEQVGNFHPQAQVPFGTLLKYTANKKEYVAMEGNETDAAVFAGIALAEKAASSTTYPGTKTQYEVGEPANVLIVGHTVVELSSADGTDADDATEGAKVYLGSDGKVTTAADNGKTAGDKVDYLLLPNLVFTGDVEVQGTKTLVGVRKLY